MDMQKCAEEIIETVCKGCEIKPVYALALDRIKELEYQVEEMAFLLWQKADSVGEQKWWKQEWQKAVVAIQKMGGELPERGTEG